MRPRAVAVFLASLALVALQVALMQSLAEAQGHHFAYLVIALALLGFGASGTALSLWRDRALAAADRLLPDLALWAGAGCAAALPSPPRTRSRSPCTAPAVTDPAPRRPWTPS